MAIFRKIHTSFWSDSFITDLEKDKKLFYIYLLTNERTRQCGVYEITKKQISYDLSYSIDTVSKLLQYFIKHGKIRYSEETKEIAIGNWLKYNQSDSPKVQQCINKEFKLVKDTVLIEYVKSMDTHPQEEQEQEQEETKEEENNKKLEIISAVFLTQEEIGKAVEYFGQYYQQAIETLSNYKNSSGKKYKSDYHALLGWVSKEIKKQNGIQKSKINPLA